VDGGGVVGEDDGAVDKLGQVRDADLLGQGADGVGLGGRHVERPGARAAFDVEPLGADRPEQRIIGRGRPFGQQGGFGVDEGGCHQIAVARARVLATGGFEEPVGLLGQGDVNLT